MFATFASRNQRFIQYQEVLFYLSLLSLWLFNWNNDLSLYRQFQTSPYPGQNTLKMHWQYTCQKSTQNKKKSELIAIWLFVERLFSSFQEQVSCESSDKLVKQADERDCFHWSRSTTKWDLEGNLRPMRAPHDPHDRPVGLASALLVPCSPQHKHTHSILCALWLQLIHAGVCGQHNAVRLLRPICSADMWDKDLWTTPSCGIYIDPAFLSGLFFWLSLVKWPWHLGANLLFSTKKKKRSVECCADSQKVM